MGLEPRPRGSRAWELSHLTPLPLLKEGLPWLAAQPQHFRLEEPHGARLVFLKS